MPTLRALLCLFALFFPLSSFTTPALAASGAALPVATSANTPKPASRPALAGRLSLTHSAKRVPVSFFPLRETSGAARYLARGADFSLAVEPAGLTLETERRRAAKPAQPPAADGGVLRPQAPEFDRSVARIDFVGANGSATLEGLDPSVSHVNYLVGKDPSQWRRNLPVFGRVRAKGLYPGIDLVYYGNSGSNSQGGQPGALEYDLVVAPHGDPARIRLRVTGSQKAVVDAEGNLLLDGASGSMRLLRPTLYQNRRNAKQAVKGSFVEVAENEFAFQLDAYDREKPLIIDPQINLLYATYAGGIHNDNADDMALDAAGNAYLVGWSASQDFPVSSNAYQTVRQAIGTYTYDMVAMKLDPSGNLLYSTYVGGTNNDYGYAIAVNPDGSVYLGGGTSSSDFPVTSNAFQPTYGGGSDGFLVKLSPDGSTLLYSTYLGGAGDEAVDKLLLNADGSLWMQGSASAAGLPASKGAVQSAPKGTDNLFVAKAVFNSSGALTLPALTYIGGSNMSEEGGYADLAVDSSGNLYLAGGTNSADYPVTSDAYEQPFPTSGGCNNSATPNSSGVLTKFSSDLTKILYSTYMGGKVENQNGYPVCNQFVRTVHLDASGNIWMLGTTGMSGFPTTANALSSTLNGNDTAGVDNFVVELSADGHTLLYGTYLGGSQFDYGSRAAWDASENIWIVGTSQSPDYPVTKNALQPTIGGGYDTTLTELSPDGTKILYATYLGGSGDDDINGHPQIKIDAQGSIRLVGDTSSTNYPVTGTAFQPLFANGDSGPDGDDVYYDVLGSGTIGQVGPVVAGDAGDTSLTISGAGFAAGATCSLVQGTTTIASAQAIVNSTGTQITCTFPLKGAALGSYDLSVTNTDGSTLSKTGAFTVQAGTGPLVSTDLVGRAKVRTATPATYSLVATNNGDSDAYFTQVWLVVPDNFNVTFPQGLYDPFLNDPASTVDLSPTVFGLLDADGLRYYSFMIPLLAPGGSSTVLFQVTVPDDESAFDIQTYNRLPWFSTYAGAKAAFDAAQATPASLATTCTPDSTGTLNNCLGAYITDAATDILATQYVGADLGDPTAAAQSLEAYIAQQLESLILPATTVQSNVSISSKVHAEKGGGGTGSGGGEGSGSKGGFSSITNSDIFKDAWGEYWNQNGKKMFDYGLCQPIDPPNRKVIQQCACGVSEEIIQLTYTCGNRLYGNGTLVLMLHSACPEMHKKKKPKNPSGTGATCKAHSSFRPGQAFSAGSRLDDAIKLHANDDDDPNSCPIPDPEDNGDPDGGSDSCGSSGGSVDPNYKTGSFGDLSTSAYVEAVKPLTYTVGFENEPTATLPAANVVVTDQLDPSKVDLSTLTLGTISFGSTVITLPTGTSIYNTTQPASSTLNVRIAGSLDQTSGLLKWTFTSIDPTTGQPPTDPTVGFLPPDTDGIVGQGSVVFNVMPKAGLTTGTAINNTATVVFDSNAAIQTPTWLNTIDVDAPVSKVEALPASQATTSIAVTWSGTDKGSGIASYNVYVSDNGGAFTVWQSGVTTTSATYTGVLGHAYGFYSIATDGVGNVEAAKTVAEATIAVGVTPDFSIGAPSSITVSPGASGSTTLSITPLGGFSSAVTFACTGLPSLASCSFAPATVTPSGGAVTTTLTIATAAPSSNVRRVPGAGGWNPVASLLLGLLVAWRVRRFRKLAVVRLGICLVALVMAGWGLTGCGGGSGPSTPTSPGTPAGTSTITVTATSGTLSHTTTVTLVVQ